MYASPVNEITSENVVLQGNSSFDPYDYPDIVKLFIPLPNTTKTKIFKYSNPVEQSQEEQQEKMLEEKVIIGQTIVELLI